MLFGLQSSKNIVMKEIKMVTKCLKKCPATYKGKKVITDSANRRC